jgi:hypothetical protein
MTNIDHLYIEYDPDMLGHFMLTPIRPASNVAATLDTGDIIGELYADLRGFREGVVDYRHDDDVVIRVDRLDNVYDLLAYTVTPDSRLQFVGGIEVVETK